MCVPAGAELVARVAIADCGHWVLEDAPDEIAGCVRAFLAARLPD